jgi:Spy/CpxP family protein refolding chaperone
MTLRRTPYPSFTSVALALAPLFALPLACNSNSKSSQAPAAASAGSAATAIASATPPPSAPPRPDARPHGRDPGGPVGTLFRGARELQLSDAQKATLDALEAQRDAPEPPSDDFKNLQADIISGIRAGKLDATKLQADFANVDKTMAARQAKEADALSGLYAALDATQRAALVAAVGTKQAARDAQFAAHSEMDAGGSPEWTKRRLDRLTAQLGLDAAQQKSAAAILAKGGDAMSPAAMHEMRDEGKKRLDAVLTAFEGSTLDAKKLVLSGVPGKTAHEGLEKDTTFVSQLLPILTPEQREKLAAQREHSSMRHHPPGLEGDPSRQMPGIPE